MNFKDKKITIMGLGLLGRGIGLVKYLVSKGARVTVTDLKSEKELRPSVSELKKFYKQIKNQKSKIKITNQKSKSHTKYQIRDTKYKIHTIKFVLGKHRLEDFRNVDMVFKAAGVPLDSPYIAETRRLGVPIFMDDALFAREAPCEIIGVTGTRGKTTTSTLIYELAKATGRKVYLAGNVRGMATLPLLDKVKKNDIVVLELSSWQLQGWRDLKISPRIAVVTNIYKDHMNYYKNSMAKYVRDKEAIFANQTKDDFLLLNKNCSWCRKMAKKARGQVVWFSINDVPQEWNLKILGAHNLENIAAALAVGKILGLLEVKIKKAVENFCGVPGRLDFVRKVGGVRYYNDTTATMPEATIAALEALNSAGVRGLPRIKAEQAPHSMPALYQGGASSTLHAGLVSRRSKLHTPNIILIAGGADKNLDFKKLASVIKKHTKAVVLLAGTATSKLQKQLLIFDIKHPISVVHSMAEAVRVARKFAVPGDIILLSPATASFGMFKNEFDRGEQFLKEVRKIGV